jgi:hypothetical protein
MEPSPELEAFFEPRKHMYLRLQKEGVWEEDLAHLRSQPDQRGAEEVVRKFDSPKM